MKKICPICKKSAKFYYNSGIKKTKKDGKEVCEKVKKRNDFVTNSSSSSYIIGKTEDTSVTREVVYQFIKRLYKELIENPDTEEFGYYSYSDFEWLKCETYEEYEAYWLDKFSQKKEGGLHAPFTIADFSQTQDVNWVHEGRGKGKHDIDSDTEVLVWYHDYAYAAFRCDGFCNMCENAKDCIPMQEEIKRRQIPEERACLYLLGRICIYSEDCFMPNYVQEKLCFVAEYACTHMG